MARNVPELIDFSKENIRVMHFTWIAFFITFYIWFNMAPLATTMVRDLDWLTPDHIKLLAICNVALTIPGRILVGALIDRYGPRICFSILLITMSIPTFVFAFASNFMQLLMARLVLSTIGAGFVIGIRMIAQWFPHKTVGRAEGFYAGWGNFGSAWAAMTLPWLALDFFGGIEHGWRWALFVNGLVSLVYGVWYLFLVRDAPEGMTFVGVKKMQPLLVSSYGDLVQYLIWSFPLMGALGVLAWRASNIPLGNGQDGNTAPIISQPFLYALWAILGLMYIAHVIKSLQVNLPHLRAGVPEDMRYSFNSVAALNTTYFTNFGAELAVVSMLPAFFEQTFTLTPEFAGLVASSFAFVNLVARPLGGLISDSMHSRKAVMLVYMGGIALGFLLMAQINVGWGVWLAVAATIFCSVFVQGAEGATFAIIPMISKRMTGQIAGMAGAYGNVGAVIYLVVLSLVDSTTFFYILAGGAALSTVYCALFLEEPESAFGEEMAAEALPA